MLTRLFAVAGLVIGVLVGINAMFTRTENIMQQIYCSLQGLASVVIIMGALIIDTIASGDRAVVEELRKLSRRNEGPTISKEPAQAELGSPRTGNRKSNTQPIQAKASAAQFYYTDNQGRQQGPFEVTAMRQLATLNDMDLSTPVFRAGGKEWQTLADFPELG